MIDKINVNGVVHKINDTEARKEIEKKAYKTEIPTKTSDLQNDSGFIDNSYHDITKQDVIEDLETIRDGASKGATALQEHQSLKTINNESIVGEGNIEIQGGGSTPVWKLFKTVEITEDVQNILINFEENNYDEIIMIGTLAGSPKGGSSHAGSRVFINNKNLGGTLNNFFPSAGRTLNIYERIFLQPTIYMLGTAGVSTFSSPTGSLGMNTGFTENFTGISSIQFSIHNNTTNYLTTGTVFKFYVKE